MHAKQTGRTELNAAAIATAKQTIIKDAGQTFYQTPKAIELWQDEPLPRRIKRWDRKAVLWIIPDEE